MTGIDPDKYRLLAAKPSGAERIYPPGTFFPLIQGDALAVMTLRSYSNNCLQLLDWGVLPVTGNALSQRERLHLEQLGQDALDLAAEWAKIDHHIPD